MVRKFLMMGFLFSVMLGLASCGTVAQAANVNIPGTIQDVVLQSAWSQLNQHTEPVELWDGYTTSGYLLAQFVLDHQIKITWGTDEICSGISCSYQVCKGEYCTHFNEDPTMNTIYMDRSYRGDRSGRANLLSMLTHEIFHYSMPFGPVEDTLFEEYMAYYLGALISGENLHRFSEVNPFQPACLVDWFKKYNLYERYRQLKAYPLSMVPTVDPSMATCSQDANNLNNQAGAKSMECLMLNDGSLSCLDPQGSEPALDYELECTEYDGGLVGCQAIWVERDPEE